MTAVIIFCLVLFTGLYFIRRGESKEKQASIIETELDDFEKAISN